MTVPADGVGRLLHFVDRRLDTLRMTKEDVAARGGPEASTLHKVLHRSSQNTPRVRTLLRLDLSLGWEPGSSAAVLLGGYPLSVTARASRTADGARPVSAEEVVARLMTRLKGLIDETRAEVDALVTRLDELEGVHHRLAEELHADPDLVAAFTTGRGDTGEHGPGDAGPRYDG
jgi:hypothetical protein